MDNAFQQNIREVLAKSSTNVAFQLRFWSHSAVCNWIDTNASDLAQRCFYLLNCDYGAARADLFRYSILHKEGGIWCDHKATNKLAGGWDDMFRLLPQPMPELIFATWGGKSNWVGGTLDSSSLLGRADICNGFLCCAPGNAVMGAVIEGVCKNILDYRLAWQHRGSSSSGSASGSSSGSGNRAMTGKDGVLYLTGPRAMSIIVYRILHLHPHLLVDGFAKLGIDFYAVRSYKQLIDDNAHSLGSGVLHYSKLRSAIVLDDVDLRWIPARTKRARGSIA